MASATRASRRMLRSFWRPFAEFTMTCSPSKSTHTGVTCGRPSGMIVPRLAKAFFWKRSRYFSGITVDIVHLSDRRLLTQNLIIDARDVKRAARNERRVVWDFRLPKNTIVLLRSRLQVGEIQRGLEASLNLLALRPLRK